MVSILSTRGSAQPQARASSTCKFNSGPARCVHSHALFSFAFTNTYTQNEPLTIEAFDLLKVIGKGSFGKVMQVRKRDTSRIYALKTIRKAHIASRPGEITHILAERTVLALVNNPFIVPLKFSFQNPEKLYLVMSFGESGCSGG
jgi:serine/threonine protein kinase